MPETPLPDRRKVIRYSVKIEGQRFYLDCGEYDGGTLGEIFLTCAKGGSFVRGMLDTAARLVSKMLQRGVPIAEVVEILRCHDFPPNGQVTGSKNVQEAKSVPDWVAQELYHAYCSGISLPQEKSFGYVAESWRTEI